MFKKELIDLYLKNGFELYEASTEIDFAFDIICGFSQTDLLMGKEPLEKDLKKIYEVVFERTLTNRPIQQILGVAYFMGEKFLVDSSTLIPRPETEILVTECLNIAKENGLKRILDIGTGSGCIDVMLAKNLENIEITSVDISENALIVAKQNAKKHNVQTKINFLKSDLFKNVTEKYDIIVSNPPYIPITDKKTLEREVIEYEPHSALFALDKDGIDFYKKITESALVFLNPSGYLAFELGIRQSDLVCSLMTSCGFRYTKVIKDLDGINRVIISCLNK